MRALNLSLHSRIFFSFLIVVLVGGIVVLTLGMSLYGKTVLETAQDQVRMDLKSAWMIFNTRVNEIRTVILLTAKRESIMEDLHRGNITALQEILERVRIDNRLDFLSLTDETGRVLVRTRHPYRVGDNLSLDAMISRALKQEMVSGTEIIFREDLEKEGQGLAEKAFMLFVDTPLAKPRPTDRETSGMVIKAAIPIISEHDTVMGVLYGGILVNRNHDIADQIQSTLYKGEIYKGKERGTATIFQWDVRISTNVKDGNGLRAIGTRVSRDVYERVLENGLPYIGRAYVVNAQYIAAYEPIRNILGETIGILYVGTLEQPFTDFRNKVIWLFLAIALAGLSVTLLFGYLLAGSITRPVTKLVGVTHEISRGQFPKEIPIYTRDEIGHLAQSFVQMSQNLEHTMNDLKELNKKYLGLLGFTTHELKQPLGVLRGYVLMLCDETLGKLTTPVQKEALLEMKNSVNALQEMITKYLQLTKIESGQLVADKRIINLYSESIRPVLEGEASHIAVQNMQVAFEQKSALEKLVLTADPALMRIVYSNLITNALKYGRSGGTIALGFTEDTNHYRFHVKNEGPGIAKERLDDIFGKFVRFEIKELGKQVGTGLGLYNTREIIEKHGGKIWAESEEGSWADFIFTLPK